MLYEERRVILKRGALAAYRELMHKELWPALEEAVGARPLCLLSGLIGAPVEQTHTFTGFSSIDDWQRVQAGAVSALHPLLARRAELLESEQVKLLLPSGPRPKDVMPPEDRRAVYGLRRFYIDPKDWPDFLRFSSEGVWVRIESQDACILGLFRDIATTSPLEVTLVTGYHSPTHWDATRTWHPKPDSIAQELWDLGQTSGAARAAITQRTFVQLMTAHWPPA